MSPKSTTPRWLLLAHQLPSEPSKLRVRAWRRLQGVGSVLIKNSVYALPNDAEAREHFEWIRGEVISHGGEAVVFSADSVDSMADDELEAAFVEARRSDWAALEERATNFLESSSDRTEQDADELAKELKALRERASQIDRIDFFGAPGKHAALDAIDLVARAREDDEASEAVTEPAQVHRADYQGRQWLTRPRPGVDRMASAWLIRRFIDPDATFSFADRIPPRGDAVPFDMYGVRFGHHGESCTFETLLSSFGLDEAALSRIGRIVHELDLHLERQRETESPTISRLIHGLRSVYSNDDELLDQGIVLFETLYRSFRDETA